MTLLVVSSPVPMRPSAPAARGQATEESNILQFDEEESDAREVAEIEGDEFDRRAWLEKFIEAKMESDRKCL